MSNSEQISTGEKFGSRIAIEAALMVFATLLTRQSQRHFQKYELLNFLLGGGEAGSKGARVKDANSTDPDSGGVQELSRGSKTRGSIAHVPAP